MEKISHDGVVVNGGNDGVLGLHAKRKKLIIDTDPGIGQFLFISLFFFPLSLLGTEFRMFSFTDNEFGNYFRKKKIVVFAIYFEK